MNWSDFVVIGIIVVFAVIGMLKGFIMSVYRLVSFVVCVFLSVKLSPIAVRILEKTAVYDTIKGMIVNNMETWSSNVLSSQPAVTAGTSGAETVLGEMPVPDVIRHSLLNNLPSPSELIDVKSISSAIGTELTGMIMSVLCLILLYFVLRLICGALGLLLRGISELPVFKQVNKAGGLVLGALQGFMTVYIIFAVLMLFNSNPSLAPIFEGLETSIIAGRFYQDNIIINFLFPSITA